MNFAKNQRQGSEAVMYLRVSKSGRRMPETG
jgi:hypothetical protein